MTGVCNEPPSRPREPSRSSGWLGSRAPGLLPVVGVSAAGGAAARAACLVAGATGRRSPGRAAGSGTVADTLVGGHGRFAVGRVGLPYGLVCGVGRAVGD